MVPTSSESRYSYGVESRCLLLNYSCTAVLVHRIIINCHLNQFKFPKMCIRDRGVIGGQKVILAKPQTYMNLSGESIISLVEYYKIDEEQELIVIYDDVSLGVGKLRILSLIHILRFWTNWAIFATMREILCWRAVLSILMGKAPY